MSRRSRRTSHSDPAAPVLGSHAPNTTDYQARRLDIRTRRDGKLDHVHTLNGTAVTARAMIAILENFQDEHGSVAVPEPLYEFGAPARLGK